MPRATLSVASSFGVRASRRSGHYRVISWAVLFWMTISWISSSITRISRNSVGPGGRVRAQGGRPGGGVLTPPLGAERQGRGEQ